MKKNNNTLDATMNIGSEVRLSETCTKNIKIGSIKLIREVRQIMNGKEYKFSMSIGREKWPATSERSEIDWPAIEAAHRQAFEMVLVGGLSQEEYDNVDEDGLKELDTLLERFL
ncbi:hypothetical protein D3C75_760340 [compost metagenome]